MKFWLFLHFLVLTIHPLDVFSRTKWEELAEKDLTRMYEAIKDNHPGYIYDDLFKIQMEQAFKVATHKLDKVSSYEGVYFLLSEFATSFQDSHVRIEETYQFKSFRDPEALFAHLELARPDKKCIEEWKYEASLPFRWPGFTVKRNSEGELLVLDGPFCNSKIIAIDGLCTELFLSKFVYPFHGVIHSLEASKIKASPMAFVDFGNTLYPVPKSCLIENAEGIQQEITLGWKEIRLKELLAATKKHQKRSLLLRELSDDILWLSIPSFLIKGKDIELFNQIIAEVQGFQNKKNFVVDLRGNGGGNSEWGRKLLLALSPSLPSLKAEDYGVKWRVSQEIFSHLKRALNRIESRLGTESHVYQEFLISSQLMEEQIKKNDYSLLKQPVISVDPYESSEFSTNPSFRKIILLTDAGCGSATLTFMDHALQLPSSVHVGQETTADSIYHDIMVMPLPSELFNITIPMKVWEKGPRGNNQPYTPSFVFKGDISKDQEVEAWVFELVNKGEV